MSPWGWTPERSRGIWRYDSAGLRPFIAAMPFLTLGILLLHLYFVSGKMTIAEGVLFDLPDAAPTDAIAESPVALMMPVSRETLVFFDDTRYVMSDAASMHALGEQLGLHFARSEKKSLIVLADRRVTNGEMMRFASLAKSKGVTHVFFAEKRTGARE